jgi:hypothetical protein
LVFDARYERVDYEFATTDNQSSMLQASLVRQSSARQRLGIVAATRRTTFDANNPAFVDYDRSELSGNWSLQGLRTEMRLEAGYSVVDADKSTSEPLFRANISRRLSTRLTLSVQARGEVVGASDALRFDQSASGIGRRTADVSTTSEPFKYRNIGASLVFEGSRYRSALDISTGRDRYRIALNGDRDRDIARFSVDARLSPRWSVGSTLEYQKEDFVKLLHAESTSKSAWLNATVLLGDSAQVSADVGHRLRDASFANGSYDETTVRLRLSYGFGRGYRPTDLRNALPER